MNEGINIFIYNMIIIDTENGQKSAFSAEDFESQFYLLTKQQTSKFYRDIWRLNNFPLLTEFISSSSS